LEFVQFHPTALYGKNILITEAARGEGGYLVNNKGRRFMEDYTPTVMELAPRDIVSRSITTEILKGNGFENAYVHLDLRHLGREKIEKRLPGIQDICIYFAGLDPVDTPIPIQPAQHYSMGGLDVDSDCASPVKGFYAAGECACVSVHGANRLGGNSLLDSIVFGKIAGISASKFINGGGFAGPKDAEVEAEAKKLTSDFERIRKRDKGHNVYQLLNDLKILMSAKAGIFRDGPQLQEGIDGLAVLREAYKDAYIYGSCTRFCQEFVTLVEFEYMMDLAEAILRGALLRTETRGSHFRTDFSKRDDVDWLKHTLAAYSEKGAVFSYRAVNVDKYKPQERKY
jgi:succinate dehydrogenase / fumarate reductase flavoprotein subunit